ncbi:MAG: aminotransferase class V-fold PLP-dependent enzyme [Geminicoccales bacterium]
MTITPEQLARLRGDTPACEHVLHFNNAGASLMPRQVYDSTTQHLALERDIGGYEAAKAAEPALNRFYHAFAELLRVQPDEIAYVENATRAWDMAFYALPLGEGDRIITHESEYASNYLAFLQMATRRGIAIDIAPSDSLGQIDVAELEKLITPKTKLISVTHVPTQGGLVSPVHEVGRFAREHDLIFLLDACQSVGQLDIDVSAIGCHLLSGTGRKYLRGPRGTGFLYVSNEIIDRLDPPFIDLHAATWTGEQTFDMAPGARRFENWESYVAGRLGLAAAVDYALEIGLAAIEARVTHLADQLRQRLTSTAGVTVHDLGKHKCGIVTFEKAGEAPSMLVERLRLSGINISASTKESAQLDLGRRGIAELARASVHYFNTDDEIERFSAIVGSA